MEASDFLSLFILSHRSQVEDRKFRTAGLLGRHPRRKGESEREGQVVERGSEIENTITDQDAKAHRHVIDPGYTNSLPDVPAVGRDFDSIRRWIKVWLVDDFLD
jgi:hypothetical protein